jgi:hypothetical protein
MIINNKINNDKNCNIYYDNDNDNSYDDEKYKNINEIDLSRNNIIAFKNKKNIPFEKLTELNILNLSYNLLSEINDVIFLKI